MRQLNWLKSTLSKEDGVASVEFIFVMPLAIAILLAAVESGMVNLRKTALDRALDMTVRELRLGQIPNPTVTDLRTRICNRLGIVEDCADNLTLELNVRAPRNSTTMVNAPPIAMPSLTDICINRDSPVQPLLTFQPGTSNELVLVRACLVQDYFFPTTPYQIQLGASDEEFRLISTTAFVNEPR